jgi:hypothetical protein
MPQYGDYLEQAKDFSLRRKRGLLDEGAEWTAAYSYDFGRLVETDFTSDPEECKRDVSITFGHSKEQEETIRQLVHQYGTSTTGLGRILLRAHIKKLFRQITVDGVTTDRGFEQSYRRSSNLVGD